MLIVKYTLFEAYKRKLLLLHAIMMFACVLLGFYARSVSITESEASFIIFYAGFARVLTVFILAVYLIVTESRNWEHSRIQNILALPISRYELLLFKCLGYLGLIVVMGLVVIIPLLCYAQPGMVIMWALVFLLELLIVLMLAMMLSLLFKQPVFSIAVFSLLYLFARVAGEFYQHAHNLLVQTSAAWEPVMAWLIKISALIVPHLSQFAASARIIYPADDYVSIAQLMLQTALYTGLLFSLALALMHKKSF